MTTEDDLNRIENFLLTSMASGKKKQNKAYARVLGYVKALQDQH